MNIRRIGQASFHEGENHIPLPKFYRAGSRKATAFSPFMKCLQIPEQLIHAIPQVIQPGTQIFHIRGINAAGLIGTPGVLV